MYPATQSRTDAQANCPAREQRPEKDMGQDDEYAGWESRGSGRSCTTS